MENLQTRAHRLSPQQDRLWTLQRNNHSLYGQMALLIEGPLDRGRLEDAIRGVVSRHEIYRTTFNHQPGLKVPLQVVRDDEALIRPQIELRSLEGKQPDLNVDEMLRDELNTGFDCAQGPLSRFSLVRLAADRHVLLVSLPALCTDAWSLKNLARQLTDAYDSPSASRPADDDSVQYSAYASWQNELLEGDDAEAGRAFWKKLDLLSIPPVSLPYERNTDQPARLDSSDCGAPLDQSLLDRCAALAGEMETTVDVVCLAVWQSLLWRLAGTHDIVVGYHAHGREYDELHDTMGPIGRCIPVHCRLNHKISFHDHCVEVAEWIGDALEWQEYFAWQRNGAQAEGSGPSPYLPVGFEFATLPAKRQVAGATFSVCRQATYTDPSHLKLICTQSDESLRSEIHFDSGRFSPDDIRRLHQQYQTLLEHALENPQAAVGSLEILDGRARTQILVEFNASKADYSDDPCVHHLFETQATLKPDATAVVYEDEAITYAELDRRANSLAACLRASGVGAGALVAIRMERCADMIVAILGTLKAGGAYVPLDPSWPRQRTELLVRDARATVILTQQRLTDSLPDCGAKVVLLDQPPDLAPPGGAGETGIAAAGDLAYAMFTSGSTGGPKGVLVEHRQLVNYIRAVRDKLELPPGAHCATVSTIAADLGNTAIFPALCTGGCLHVIAQSRLSDPDAMADYFARRRIDCLKIVPSHLDALLASAHPQHLLSCRRLVLGGEASRWNLIERIKTLSPECEIFNHYGPTEATVGALAFRFENGRRDDRSATLPIGRPLANYHAYVLDAHSRPVPVGIPGELILGGDGVSRGYLHRAGMTAERFVPDPFSSEAGARCYRTGDLARYLPDGNVEFLGRVDHQVKIRGFRIELGEIETTLAQHPHVHESVVIVRGNTPDDKRLVAYVVPKSGQHATVDGLRSFVDERLPEYMMPAAFVLLEKLPLNQNGKVDRGALPEPDQVERRGTAPAVAPRTPTEEKLAGLWASLLRKKQISVHDDFFELGGHSLLAMQLVSRIRKAFRLELPLLSVFESPTVAGLAEQIDRVRDSGSTVAPAAGIEPAARDGNLPASFSQERLWLFDQVYPGSHAYNIPIAVRLTGTLDVAALTQTVNELVRRHEVLRTTFDTAAGETVQVIAPAAIRHVDLVDLRGLPPARKDVLARSLLNAEAHRPFDLASGPLWRARLLRITDQEHIVLWTQHHITSDGWSSSVFVREVSHLYTAFSAGERSTLPELIVQYADYSSWQRRWLQGESRDAQLAYWTERLSGAPPVLPLPTDRPRPAVQSFRGGTESIVLPKALSQALATLSRDEQATTYMTLLAAFQALLYLHTGQEDIVVGSPIAGRNQAETEGLIGYFLNTLALRTRVDDNSGFRDLLRRVRREVLEAFAHQDLPFETIIEALDLERDASRTPLYQVMFNLQKASEVGLALGDVRVEPLASSGHASKFDLTLYATESRDDIALVMAYSSDLFDSETIRHMLGHLKTLLQAVVSDPDQRISALRLRTDIERTTRHATGLSRPPRSFVEFTRDDIESTIAARFERQVAAHPRRTAVKTRKHDWTYERLNDEADRVANRILAQLEESDERIGLLLGSDAPLIAGMMGVLKAHKTYVPLDPANPPERLAFMLSDSQARLILTDDAHEPLARRIAADSIRVINIEQRDETLPSGPVVVRTSPDGIAYILYTSGSTGNPKGVVQNHRNVLHFMRVYTNNLRLSHEDRLTLLSSYGFDGAVMDIFGALLNGAMLCPLNLRQEGLHGCLQWMTSQEITVFHSTPTVFRQVLCSADAAATFPHARLVVLGGEEALPGDLGLFKKHFSPTAVFVNGLGPSESTVTLQHFMDASTEITRTSIPVGLPVEDTDILLLTPAGDAAEVHGEIAIQSRHVALGYWQNHQATSAAFLPDPTGGERRIYRTGDLGRRLPDGGLEFLGRRDSQVKIRGCRVELGEIEAVLGEHPDVAECAVVAVGAGSGQSSLVAYVQPVTPHRHAVPEMRSYLKQKLPDYMVPADIVLLESFPLTPNGKLDRDALPAPDQVQPECEREFVAPRTPFEEITAALWMEVLPVARVGVDDNFFDLGGHSLLAMRLVARIRETLKIEVPLRILFEAPTLARMAHGIEQAKRAAAGNELSRPAVSTVDRSGEVPLSFAQQRMWLLDQLQPGDATYNESAAVRLQGPLCVQALEQAISQIVGRHEVLRTTFGKSPQGNAVQVIGPARERSWPVVDLSSLPEDQCRHAVRRLGSEEAARPFNLATGPLLRVTLLRVGAREHIALFTMHHIVTDAWSAGVFVNELSELYAAHSNGCPSPLADLPIQYADFASWQRRWLQGETLQSQLAYWTEQLRDAPPYLDLPLDRPRPADGIRHGARESFSLPDPLVASLRKLSGQEGATLFMTLLAAFQVLLSRYTRQDDVVVGTPIAGRTLTESEGLIGFFVNMLVLRSRIDRNASFREFVRHVREVALDAHAHQDLPFEKLVEELDVEREMSRTPLFQVMFVLQNAPVQALRMSELSLTPVNVEARTAKFDWWLSMRETENGLAGTLEYSTDMFNAATIKRMLGHFETLLAALVADPSRRLADAQILPEPERRQLLTEWNSETGRFPQERCIHELFEEQVAETPDRVALVFEDTQLTYRELDARANKLAHHLRRLGVGPDHLVGICLERSLDTVVGVLGILKAGGAYVPIDPSYPKSRLAFMLADAGLKVVVTTQPLAELLSDGDIRFVCLDADWPVIDQAGGHAPAAGTVTDNLAYVIYTSGSTGQPKGTPVTHRNVVRLFSATEDWFHFNHDDVWTLFHSYAFDFSVWEIWGAICYGGRLVVVPFHLSRSPQAFYQLLSREAVTVLNQTPSAFKSLVAAEGELPAGPDALPLRFVIFGGEALDVNHLEPWFQRHGSRSPRLINMYGITETTVHVTYHPVVEHTESASHDSRIGRPIPDLQTYVLDQNENLAPLGIAGEIHVGGAGLARGYLNRPDLSAERFIANPFSDTPGARLYRTGDLARWLSDGDLEYLGRIDHQVKIRGFRIELGEIETLLSQHADIRQVVVIARVDSLGNSHLVAYLSAAGDPAPTVSELRRYLEERLPGYMVPAAFMFLDSLPLTPNGKIDRRALPEPDQARPELEDPFVAPRDDMEERLARIWCEVLDVDQVGAHDNFFDLGGNSLLAVQIITRVEREFGVPLDFKELIFESMGQIAVGLRQATSTADMSEAG